jgi:uncharacterized membrane protein
MSMPASAPPDLPIRSGLRYLANLVAVVAVVVTVLALFASFLDGFAILTGCTDENDCSSEWCSPCRTASIWLTGGTIAEGVLLLVAIVLVVAANKSRRLVAVAACAAAVMLLSIGALVGTDRAADRSFCHLGDPTCGP